VPVLQEPTIENVPAGRGSDDLAGTSPRVVVTRLLRWMHQASCPVRHRHQTVDESLSSLSGGPDFKQFLRSAPDFEALTIDRSATSARVVNLGEDE
jgi:hypothetical protein